MKNKISTLILTTAAILFGALDVQAIELEKVESYCGWEDADLSQFTVTELTQKQFENSKVSSEIEELENPVVNFKGDRKYYELRYVRITDEVGNSAHSVVGLYLASKSGAKGLRALIPVFPILSTGSELKSQELDVYSTPSGLLVSAKTKSSSPSKTHQVFFSVEAN